MKKFLVIALAVACIATWAFAEDTALKVGSIVAAKWTSGSWYRGTIASIKGGKFNVAYDDGDKATLERKDIKLISAKPKVAKGQKVFALWKDDGTFYLGTVSAVTKTGVTLAWDDGSERADIAFGYFTTDVTGLAASGAASSGGGASGTASSGAASSASGKSVTLWQNGSRIGEVEPSGRVWIDGSIAGEIGKDGAVWKGGSKVGEIEANGKIWEEGSLVGEIEKNGRVWKGGSIVGEIEPNGKIWKGGSIVGEAPGIPRPWVAAIYFFFFVDE